MGTGTGPVNADANAWEISAHQIKDCAQMLQCNGSAVLYIDLGMAVY